MATLGNGYDDVYRLTSETISGATSQNGAINYTYDAVGNRRQLTSTVPIIPSSGLMNYNANDQLATDAYDANGNTIVNASTTNVYDFENHLVQHDAVTIAYDADGNRVAETTGAGTTQYLLDTLNPTGYAQVVDELQSGGVTRRYIWGLELISQSQISDQQTTTSFYGFDGHGSVRFLTDSAGAITDTYDYDAFGNLLASTGSTSNNYRFAGEQFDPALGIYYNRARYYDERNGRFWTDDSYEGNLLYPASLNGYAYSGQNPVDHTDPSGNDFSLGEITTALAVAVTVFALSTVAGPEREIAPSGGLTIGQLIANRASSYQDSFRWQQICRLDHGLPVLFPETCNQFVYDVLREVGAAPPLVTRNTVRARLYEGFRHKLYQTPLLAEEWANPALPIPDWDIVAGGSSAAQAGDVIAEQHHNNAGKVHGGHSGIVVAPGQTASSAFENPETGLPVFGTILINDWGFRATSPNGTGLARNSVVRRYRYADFKP